MLPVVLVMSFTRPGALAFALALGLHVVHRWWRRRATSRSRVREPSRASTAAVVTGLLGLAWPVVAGLVTGRARTRTPRPSSRGASAYIGYGQLVPFTPVDPGCELVVAGWFGGGSCWSSSSSPSRLLLLSPAGRRSASTCGSGSVAYALYLLAVFFPQSSTLRC